LQQTDHRARVILVRKPCFVFFDAYIGLIRILYTLRCRYIDYTQRLSPTEIQGVDIMIFQQLFDKASSTYTYLLAERQGGEALLIDPVVENTGQYVRLIEELDLKLVMAVDSHIHADHVTALGALHELTDCSTAMGAMSQVECVTQHFHEGEKLCADNLQLDILYTPGHTDDSYCFLLPDRVFTGDTLLIRGTGRTDFQNGDPAAQYDSLFDKLLKLPEDILVYPAHDYNGLTVSTIGEEKRHNPRLQVSSMQAYIELMNGLELEDPQLMDIAVPANLACGALKAA
jgi:glyoxylase-like metal-dependent hydrolase (beta-lactamase superfamily II)